MISCQALHKSNPGLETPWTMDGSPLLKKSCARLLRMATEKHDISQAIADPTRRQMIRLLADQERSVTAISKHFPMSRTGVSKHLRILSES